MKYISALVILFPLIGAGVVAMMPRRLDQEAGTVALWFSRLTWVISLPILLGFDRSTATYQYVLNRNWPLVGDVGLGVDGISVLFVRLTTMLLPICLLSAWSVIRVMRREFFSLFLLRESMILVVFRSMDVLVFYVSFEAVLIPMFLLVGVWGSRERKVRAANRFFLYTLFGSVWRLLALLLIYFEAGTMDLSVLMNTSFSESRQKLLWLAFFIAFAVKVPRLPFHIWLPEAHVESPTAGSVVLAALLLKFGLYAFVRRSLPLFPVATTYFTPLVQVMAIVAVIYTSLTARRQTDRKRIIAYSSVAHMNLGLLGVFSCTLVGIEGALFLGLSHGVVSGALFLCVGVLYDRHHSRIVSYYGGLAQLMPMYIATFMLFTRANIALPGTSSFVGELMILLGAFLENHAVAVLGASGMILGGGYSLWLLNRLAFGTLKNDVSTDRNRREFTRRLPLIILAVIGGIIPQPVIDRLHTSTSNILEHMEIRSNGDIESSNLIKASSCSIAWSSKTLGGTLMSKYGVGRSVAVQVCNELGYLPSTPYVNLSVENRNQIQRYTEINKGSREVMNKDIAHKVKVGCTQGIRMRMGRPVRGQRTHTNASTARMLNAARARVEVTA